MNETMTDTVVFRRPKLFENVAQALREQILSGDFEIGARLLLGHQFIWANIDCSLDTGSTALV